MFPQSQLFTVRMGQALLHSGRPMVFSLSVPDLAPWIGKYCNLPRVTGDLNQAWSGILSHIDLVAQSPYVSEPGLWNDPDVVEVDVIFTPTENHSIFSMWSMMAPH